MRSFLFDFSGDLYGQDLDVAFIGWIREELKFAAVEELVRQMQADSTAAREMLAQAGEGVSADLTAAKFTTDGFPSRE